MLRAAVATGRPGLSHITHSLKQSLTPGLGQIQGLGLDTTAACSQQALLLLRRGVASGAPTGTGPDGVPTGPQCGYNDTEETSILEESEEQMRQDRENAEMAAAQAGGVSQMSAQELGASIAHESREAAAEHDEDATDASQVQGDTLTNKNILQGKDEGHSTSV